MMPCRMSRTRYVRSPLAPHWTENYLLARAVAKCLDLTCMHVLAQSRSSLLCRLLCLEAVLYRFGRGGAVADACVVIGLLDAVVLSVPNRSVQQSVPGCR
jgi:hypothetical protein